MDFETKPNSLIPVNTNKNYVKEARMEFEMKSHVYIKTDEQDRIVRCEGEYTLPSDLSGWLLIDEGEPCDKRNLAQSHYFPGGLYTMDGIPRYRWDGSAAVLRTEEELEEDRAARPAPEPTEQEQLRADVDFLLAMGGVL